MHGRTSEILHSGSALFENVKNPFIATRYHSLVISPEGFPGQLLITAKTADGVIMAVQHKSFPIAGVQFHPESILTSEGETIMRNWITM
jgi:anthranilate/para-aminobenzoate synthase component II